MMNRYMTLLLSLLMLAFFAGCKERRAPEEAKRPEITGVKVETVSPSTVEEYYEVAGTVRARTVSVISSRLMGTVTSVEVKEGQRVKMGQLLLVIDDRDAAARARAAEEALKEAMSALEAAGEQKDLADVTYERYRNLFEEKALSRQELDSMETGQKVAQAGLRRAEAAVERARASLKEAEVFLGFARVTTPVSGIVTEKKIDPGSMAVPGAPLLTLEDDSAYRIEVNVDERFIEYIKTGMAAEVSIPSIDRRAEGKVLEAVPSVNPASRTFLVKLGLADSALKGGLYGRVRFKTGTKQAIALPHSAIVQRGQLTGVYSVDENGVVTYRMVRVGKGQEGMVEILSGVKPGDKVIVEGAENAMDGGVLKE
jgi:RND family efflux transporter MFP subunit